MDIMNYVELTYNALSQKYNAVAETKRFEVIRTMNEGGDLNAVDMALEEWALAITKGQLLNTLVDRKDETQTGQNQTADVTQPQN